jgi:TonB-linked SusC/RagA family outer membrane protein
MDLIAFAEKITSKPFLVMKFMVLFLFIACMQAEAGIYAQKISLSVRNAPIEKVFKEIEKLTGYHFLYTNEMLQDARKVTLEIKDGLLNEALEQTFRNQPLTYTFFEKTVVVKTKRQMAIDNNNKAAETPPVQIKGTVVDENGLPMQGVSVLIKGTKAGTQTDKDGNFSVAVADAGERTLVFGYVGYKKLSVTSSGGSPIAIKMQKEVSSLDDIVVMGYQTVKRRDLSGAISSTDSKQIRDIPVNSAAEALTGRLAGVQIVTTDGEPGTDAQIKVRGGISITQDNSPLYIIDGVQVENGLSYIAPQDIESVDVLKDASSTAIYGARGANGVVIITTKSGKDSRTTVAFNSFVGIRKLANELPVMKPYDFVTYQYERTRGSAKDSTAFSDTYGQTWGDLDKWKNTSPVDWQHQVFGRNALMQTHNISISGGNKSTRFNLSGTLNNEDGIMITSGYQRKLVNFRFDHTANDKLQVGFTVRYNNQEREGAGTNTENGNEYGKLRATVKYRPMITNSSLGVDDYDADYFDQSSSGNGLSIINPVVLSNMSYRKQNTDAVNLGGYFTYTFNNLLSFKSTIGADLNFQTRNAFDDTLTNNSKNNAGGTPVVRVTTQNVRTLNNSNVLTFSNSKLNTGFNSLNKFSVLLGQETYTMNTTSNDLQLGYFPIGITAIKALGQLNLGTPFPLNPVSNQSESAIYSMFSRVDYSYDRRYIASFSIRGDMSSKFAPGRRLGYFPAGSFAWRVSQEKFMQNVSFLSDLKLRASYGLAGNNRISDYLYLTTMSATASNGTPVSYGLNGGNIPGFASSYLANSFLQWEKAISRNIGLDLGLFNNRLQVTVDAYINDGQDLLVTAPIPSTSGYATQLQNIGTTRNRGIELQLSGSILAKKAFTWTASFNMAFNKNTIRKLAGNQLSYFQASGWGFSGALPDFLVKVNQPVGTIYGFQSDGFYTLNDFDYNTTTGVYTPKKGVVGTSFFGIPEPGTIKVKDLNGDGIVDADNDRKALGNTQPLFFGGLNQQFSYKNFDLSVFMNFSYGNKILNASKIDLSNAYNVGTNMLSMMSGRWKTIDNNGKLLEQVVSSGSVQYVVGAPPAELAAANPHPSIWQPLRGSNSAIAVTSWAVEDGSFLRVNNITLGYTLPLSLVSKAKIKRLRIYGTVNNLAVFTKYTGADPEVNTQRSSPLTPGVDYSAYPRSHAYILGVNLTL